MIYNNNNNNNFKYNNNDDVLGAAILLINFQRADLVTRSNALAQIFFERFVS